MTHRKRSEVHFEKKELIFDPEWFIQGRGFSSHWVGMDTGTFLVADKQEKFFIIILDPSAIRYNNVCALYETYTGLFGLHINAWSCVVVKRQLVDVLHETYLPMPQPISPCPCVHVLALWMLSTQHRSRLLTRDKRSRKSRDPQHEVPPSHHNKEGLLRGSDPEGRCLYFRSAI
ncbi:hypothetical protein CAPTEDRAFT_211987 [Capitella teleta]|uniref:Uncharacterized protein n=1 Tax=Capitella teleta TaxID=283909 RepID=R7T3R8_CAPTE|nr:hypothetical protein CAPTEDRAFT_211987 [Capitella teleta]|eukprot:ELT87388.1 hypothetical protein CAPTEDRAFT_211987 [Capitella teleta]